MKIYFTEQLQIWQKSYVHVKHSKAVQWNLKSNINFFFYFKELTSQKEKDFLTVLSMIKNKDPKIYEKDSNFYHEDGMAKDA